MAMMKYGLQTIVLVSLCGHLAAGAKADLIRLQPPCGEQWWNQELGEVLAAKPFLSGLHRIGPGAVIEPDWGRPASLGDVPGDRMEIRDWIFWFNDYLDAVIWQGRRGAGRRIVVFHSCQGANRISMEGKNLGNPFSSDRSLRNYQAVFRHPEGPDQTYTFQGTTYRPLDQVFAAHPDQLFIFLTPPPLHARDTNARDAELARRFADWLKNDWLATYREGHPELNNVAVFDWFDLLANPPDAFTNPNCLGEAFGGGPFGATDLKPTAIAVSTAAFAADPEAFLDRAWSEWGKARLFFAQFGGGDGFTSDLILNNPSDADALVRVSFWDAAGAPMEIPLTVNPQEILEEEGQESNPGLRLRLPAGTMVTLSTSGEGGLQVGGARVVAGEEIGGVVRFSTPGIGIAGVGSSPALQAFMVPVRMTEEGLRTGLALLNGEGRKVTVELQLFTITGEAVPDGRASLELPAQGHHAAFLDELLPELSVDSFLGILKAEASGAVAATALEQGTVPGAFTTLPVIPVP